jgi:hypothetical protein
MAKSQSITHRNSVTGRLVMAGTAWRMGRAQPVNIGGVVVSLPPLPKMRSVISDEAIDRAVATALQPK